MQTFKRWVIFTAVPFLLISAALVNSPTLYYMSALLLALPLVSYLFGAVSLRKLSFERSTIPIGWEGGDIALTFRAQSHSSVPRLFLRGIDVMPPPLQPREACTSLFNIPANATVSVPYIVNLTRRGVYPLHELHIQALDPLGIFSFNRKVKQQADLTVFPVPQTIPDFVTSGVERYGLRDLPVSAARGSGMDPDGVREYVPGDPLRRMHWKSTARTGRLSVIEFEESRSVNVVIALDNTSIESNIDQVENPFEYSIRLAASIAQLVIRQGAAVRLSSGDSTQLANTMSRGSDHLYAILGDLARITMTNDNPSISKLLSRQIGHLTAGTTLVVITSNLDEGLANALTSYISSGIPSIACYIDGRSFPDSMSRITEKRQIEWLHELRACGILPVVIRYNEDRQLRPEIITDVQYQSINSHN